MRTDAAHHRELRSVYPHATVDGPLRVHRPRTTTISARAWTTVIAVLVGVAVVIVLLGWLVSPLVGVERFNLALGGSGDVYTDSGKVDALHDTWLADLMLGSLAAAAATYVLLRVALKPPWRRDHRMSWERWASDRGLQPMDDAERIEWRRRVKGSSLGPLRDGRRRDWKGPWHGRVGDRQATVGATAWTTGSGKGKQRHHVFFAYVELTEHAAREFRGTSLTRYLRGISDVDLDIEGEELRLESIGLDNGSEILVAGQADDERWRQLFDPPMVTALLEEHDVQWQHRGRHVVFCTGGRVHGRAPARTLDTLCAGAAFVCGRIERAATVRTLARSAIDPGGPGGV